mmetsp:Transcript_21902/g.52114  ORF Transcript_21902/g.52114 Transcript_21902/m.52114 type:complete len:292 (-) Transcript_21902:91-966(-)
MLSNEQGGGKEKLAYPEALNADDSLSPNTTAEGNDDDRLKSIEKRNAVESNPLEDSNDFDDTDSLLPVTSVPRKALKHTPSKITSLDIDDGGNDDVLYKTSPQNSNRCFGLTRSTRRVGKMRILYPEYFYSSGWGVIGPNLIGPAVVFLILVLATHGVINGIKRHNLGAVSAVIAYIFLAVSIYRLTDVCYRDPGICLDQEIPCHEPPERASEYRYCDRCKVWQPPDGVHCPECDVCVAGYDHYCVWMGTCIGKRNYRQFVKFNITWVFYILYAVFWVAGIGPLVMKHRHT